MQLYKYVKVRSKNNKWIQVAFSGRLSRTFDSLGATGTECAAVVSPSHGPSMPRENQYGDVRRTQRIALLRNRVNRAVNIHAYEAPVTVDHRAVSSRVVIDANQEICRTVITSLASDEKDALRDDYEAPVTNGEQTSSGRKMSTIKTTGTASGGPRLMPCSYMMWLSHIKYEHFVAGISGGVVSTLMLHPLDLIKIRFAVNDGITSTAPKYTGLRNAMSEIVKVEGVRGLYRGVMPNVLGSGCSWGFYFFFYNSIKTWVQDGNVRIPPGWLTHLFCAANAGVLTLLITNPIWVVKTRLCLQYTNDVHLAESKRYSGVSDALTKIYRTEGVRGLYKGFVPGMFGVSHGAIQFMAYEGMKDRYNEYRNVPIDTKIGTMEYMVFAAISKLIAAALTYPYQVVRARLQDHHHEYRGTWHCIKATYRGEGAHGFYKGLGVNLTRVVPATILTFVTYEHVSHALLGMKKITVAETTTANPVAVRHEKN